RTMHFFFFGKLPHAVCSSRRHIPINVYEFRSYFLPLFFALVRWILKSSNAESYRLLCVPYLPSVWRFFPKRIIESDCLQAKHKTTNAPNVPDDRHDLVTYGQLVSNRVFPYR